MHVGIQKIKVDCKKLKLEYAKIPKKKPTNQANNENGNSIILGPNLAFWFGVYNVSFNTYCVQSVVVWLLMGFWEMTGS